MRKHWIVSQLLSARRLSPAFSVTMWSLNSKKPTCNRFRFLATQPTILVWTPRKLSRLRHVIAIRQRSKNSIKSFTCTRLTKSSRMKKIRRISSPARCKHRRISLSFPQLKTPSLTSKACALAVEMASRHRTLLMLLNHAIVSAAQTHRRVRRALLSRTRRVCWKAKFQTLPLPWYPSRSSQVARLTKPCPRVEHIESSTSEGAITRTIWSRASSRRPS